MSSQTLPAGGIATVQIKNIWPKYLTQSELTISSEHNNNRFSRYRAKEDSTATVTAMIIQPNDKFAKFYAYCNKTEKSGRNATCVTV